MHSIDMKIEFKGASNKRAEMSTTENLEWAYLVALDNPMKFRMYCADEKYDGMMVRDDGICINVDPAIVRRVTNGSAEEVR